jgi:long-subunit acyl-CoA synthetase (AMP-forming)
MASEQTGAGVGEQTRQGSPVPAHASTLIEAFERTCGSSAEKVAIRGRDDQQTLTWAQWRERSRALAGGLHRLGLRRGEPIALLLCNRPDFHVCDLAAAMLGATPFSIYQTSSQNQIEFVVADAKARIAIVEARHLPLMLAVQQAVPALEHVILLDPQNIDGEGHSGGAVLALSEVEASGRDEDLQSEVQAASHAISPEDVLTLIYTSGTTGPPKGVQLTHRNVMAAVAAVERVVSFPEDSKVISWLPAAHVAERTAHHYIPIVYGMQVTTCDDPQQVLQCLPEVRPQWFFAVPRIWEKLKAGLEAMLAGLPEEQRVPTEQAFEAALEKVRLEQAGSPIPEDLAQKVAEADERVFTNLRAMLGLDEVAAVNVGAAPTPVEVLEFFHAIGIPLAELWGMSETCGAGCVNPAGRIKLGTVGPPVEGVELKLASDGEVLVRGEVVMAGYRGDPERTAEAIDAEGWLHTGDVGELDADGYLKIVDRKKELIINAAGKNMSPANIEATLKGASPLIGQVCAIGDGRRYNTALIVLDADFAPAFAKRNGLRESTLEQMAGEPAVIEAVQAGVDAANERLSRVEQIKRFTILPGDWLPGGDELTPTMKLKRRPIAEKHSQAIEAMYE